jgi:acyl-CoA thioester hydrolase
LSTPGTFDVEARSYELDPYGHLNNAVYVNWLEHGRLCYLRDRGLTYMSVPEDFGVWVVVVRLDLSYKAPVHLGDRLSVTSRIDRFGTTSFGFRQVIDFADGRPAAEADVAMVCVDAEGRPASMPPALRERLES